MCCVVPVCLSVCLSVRPSVHLFLPACFVGLRRPSPRDGGMLVVDRGDSPEAGAVLRGGRDSHAGACSPCDCFGRRLVAPLCIRRHSFAIVVTVALVFVLCDCVTVASWRDCVTAAGLRDCVTVAIFLRLCNRRPLARLCNRCRIARLCNRLHIPRFVYPVAVLRDLVCVTGRFDCVAVARLGDRVTVAPFFFAV